MGIDQEIEELNKQIDEMQKIYDNDLKRGVNEENDQIQANRIKKIHELEDKLDDKTEEKEIAKLDELNKRKEELEKKLEKKLILKEYRKQAEEEMVKQKAGSKEYQEAEKDVEKINEEILSLNEYEEELNNVIFEINLIKEKYNIKQEAEQEEEENPDINDIYNKSNNQIKFSDEYSIHITNERTIDKMNKINGLFNYGYSILDKNGELVSEEKNIYLDELLDLDRINKDEKYAEAVKSFLSPERIKKLEKEAEGKGVVDSLYIGKLEKNTEDNYEEKMYTGEDLDRVYDKLSKSECEKKQELAEDLNLLQKESYSASRQKLIEKLQEEVKQIKSERPDLYKKKLHNKINIPSLSIPKVQKANKEEKSTASNLINGNQKSENKDNTSLIDVNKENKFISFIKNIISKVKNKFSKSKDKQELDFEGQAWMDLIEQQEEKNDRNNFIDRIKNKNINFKISNKKSKEVNKTEKDIER